MKRTQIGWVFLIIIPLIIAVMAYATPDTTAISIGVAVAFILLLLFYKLTIEVTDESIRFSLGIGIISRTYQLSDVIYCKPITYFALGWGIRYRPGAILYNVSGNKAIELQLKSKHLKVWIGTDCPEELTAYINQQMRNRQ